MNLEIIISILLIASAIFYKYLRKFPSRGNNWKVDNKKLEKALAIMVRIIIFVLGVIGLIHSLFFNL